MKILFHIGRYFILMAKVFARPEKGKVYFRQTMKEFENLGFNSVGIVVIISIFMGAVIALQSSYGMESPLLQDYLVGIAARDTMLLEFSSTMVGLILAGKVGSNIASEIGTMRISEQIDALEIMGVNPANYLILPKVIASLVFNPFLTIISIFVGIVGGWMAVVGVGAISSHDYIYGLQYAFDPFNITYTLIKTVIFAFIITTVPAYHGYYANGGALEVGRASTKGVVYSTILILIFNLVVTHLMLA